MSAEVRTPGPMMVLRGRPDLLDDHHLAEDVRATSTACPSLFPTSHHPRQLPRAAGRQTVPGQHRQQPDRLVGGYGRVGAGVGAGGLQPGPLPLSVPARSRATDPAGVSHADVAAVRAAVRAGRPVQPGQQFARPGGGLSRVFGAVLHLAADGLLSRYSARPRRAGHGRRQRPDWEPSCAS